MHNSTLRHPLRKHLHQCTASQILALHHSRQLSNTYAMLSSEAQRDHATAAWNRMAEAGAQLMSWFGVACELHRDWRNDVEGLGTLFSNHIPDYRNLITSYTTLKGNR